MTLDRDTIIALSEKGCPCARCGSLEDYQKRSVGMGIIALIGSLISSKSSQSIKTILHEKPNRGRYIKKGRKKLAANLRLKDLEAMPDPEMRSEQAVVINFKKAKTEIIEPE